MRWAEIRAKKVNVRLPDFGITMGKGDVHHFTETDFRRSEYLQWAVRQEQVDFRWVNEVPVAPPMNRMKASRNGPSQAAPAPQGDLSGLLAELIVKTDAARKEQKDLFAALLSRQQRASADIQNLTDSIDRLADALVHSSQRQSLPPVVDIDLNPIRELAEQNGELIRSVLEAVGKIRTSGPVAVSGTVTSKSDGLDEVRFIPKSTPSKIGEINLDIEEQESEASVDDAMAALRRLKKQNQ